MNEKIEVLTNLYAHKCFNLTKINNRDISDTIEAKILVDELTDCHLYTEGSSQEFNLFEGV